MKDLKQKSSSANDSSVDDDIFLLINSIFKDHNLSQIRRLEDLTISEWNSRISHFWRRGDIAAVALTQSIPFDMRQNQLM